jgi:hypothetical protein
MSKAVPAIKTEQGDRQSASDTERTHCRLKFSRRFNATQSGSIMWTNAARGLRMTHI